MTAASNLAREIAESMAKLHTDTLKNPQLAAMFRAAERTKEEQAELHAADAKVSEATDAVNAAGIALDRARRGMDASPGYDKSRPFSFFQRSPNAYKAAQAALPGLRSDLEEARTHLQNAIRRRNATERSVNSARQERRIAAKLAHAPKRAPVESRGDRWQAAGLGGAPR